MLVIVIQSNSNLVDQANRIVKLLWTRITSAIDMPVVKQLKSDLFDRSETTFGYKVFVLG